MACGWEPEDRRAAHPEGLKSIGEIEWPHPVCPGWAAALPLVADAWRARSAAEAGIFPQRYPRAPRVLMDAVLVANRAAALATAAQNRPDGETDDG